jgi:cysteine desulfurase
MIYLDYNATTPLCDAAREAMMPYLDRHFGNPSSVHAAGREARAAIDNSRDKLAALLRIKPHEIIFTSGATESCNLAVFGLARRESAGAGHIISAQTEHHAVLNPVEHLEKHEGFEVTWLNVSRDGVVDIDHLANSIRPETRLVLNMRQTTRPGSFSLARNLANLPRARRAAAQRHGAGVRQIDVDLSLVDAASFCAHKFYGPKGTRLVFLRSGLSIQPVMFGGAHENQRRPGQKTSPRLQEWQRRTSGR